MANKNHNKINEVLKPKTIIKLKIIETGQTIECYISKNRIIQSHPLPEAICQALTTEKLENFTDRCAILTAHDGIERSCIIYNYDDCHHIAKIELRSIDLTK